MVREARIAARRSLSSSSAATTICKGGCWVVVLLLEMENGVEGLWKEEESGEGEDRDGGFLILEEMVLRS